MKDGWERQGLGSWYFTSIQKHPVLLKPIHGTRRHFHFSSALVLLSSALGARMAAHEQLVVPVLFHLVAWAT